MLQLQFGTWLWVTLFLGVFSGSRRQTDEQIHHKDLTDSNGFENAEIILEEGDVSKLIVALDSALQYESNDIWHDGLLWGGMEILANETIRIEDEELASLRPAKRLLHILKNEIPKSPAGIEELLDYLSQSDIPITPKEFDQLCFMTVYCAYQIRSVQDLEKNVWISLFSKLVTEIFRELCKHFCSPDSMDSLQLMASSPWQEMPFYITELKKIYRSSIVKTKEVE